MERRSDVAKFLHNLFSGVQARSNAERVSRYRQTHAGEQSAEGKFSNESFGQLIQDVIDGKNPFQDMSDGTFHTFVEQFMRDDMSSEDEVDPKQT